LLKFRLRSADELAKRLKHKKFPEETTKRVISFLKEKRFIDDTLFAKAWLDSRLKKSLGLRRIRQELKLKGVDKEIVEEQINNIKSYSETETVSEIAKERLIKLRGIEQRSAKAKVYGYLIRRGFAPEIVVDTLNQLCR